MALFNQAKVDVLNGTHQLDAGGQTYKVMLLKSSYTFDLTDVYVSDLSADEVSVTSYARQTLTGRALALDSGNNRAKFTANSPSFGSLGTGQTAGGAVIFRDLGTGDGTAKVVIWIPFSPTIVLGGTLDLNWNTLGIQVWP